MEDNTSRVISVLVNVKAYQIVEFVNEKDNGTISIDCVPSKWVTFDEKLHACVCKFMPPPYNTKSRLKLDSYVMSKSKAPESWPLYPIYVRGDAGKNHYFNITISFKISIKISSVILFLLFIFSSRHIKRSKTQNA